MDAVADLDEWLGVIPKDIKYALNGYESSFSRGPMRGVNFGDVPRVERTPDKGYTARTVVPVLHRGRQVGDLVVAIFQPGDGTGGTETYSLDDLVIPPCYKFDNKSWRVIPKSKDGILLQAFFPLFTWNVAGENIHYWITCLEQLSFPKAGNPTRLGREFILGDRPNSFITKLGSVLESRRGIEVELTCGYRVSGERFGDPHSVFAPNQIFFGNRGPFVQCVGFLSVLSEDKFTEGGDGRKNPLFTSLYGVARIPRRG